MKTGRVNAPEDIEHVLLDLLSKKYVVWMVGSQLNPKPDLPPNDWDFIVEGNPDLLQKMAALAVVPDMDLMIATNGDDFYKPWKNPTSSSGSKSRWNFQTDSSNSNLATYNPKLSDRMKYGYDKQSIAQKLTASAIGDIIFA